mgnify:CR=1 FL=1
MKYLKPIYIQAFFILIVYTLITKVLFFQAVLWRNEILAYGLTSLVSALFGVLFLYLFGHKDFFPFAKIIEKKGLKREKKFLHYFSHFSRYTTTFLIALVGGPLFAALSARFLIHRKINRYIVVFSACFISTILWLGYAKGAFLFLNNKILN